MKAILRFEAIREAHQGSRFEFIVIELELAETFSQMALSSRDLSRARRNAEHARHSYATAMKFYEASNLNAYMNREVRLRMEQAERLMARLPRDVSPA